MIEFIGLNAGNWYDYRDEVMSTENEYPETLRWEENDYFDLMLRPEKIARLAFFDGCYLGNVMGHSVRTFDDLVVEEEIEFSYEPLAIHLINIVVVPEHRSKGYGMALLEDFITEAKDTGFGRVVGIFRPSTSLRLMRKLGAKELATLEDYAGSGEDCIFCELTI